MIFCHLHKFSDRLITDANKLEKLLKIKNNEYISLLQNESIDKNDNISNIRSV